jgi:hypothetical protein
MTLATRLRNVANTLLTNYGETVSFSRDTNSEYFPSNGNVVLSSTLTYAGKGHPTQYTTDEIDNVTIFSTDVKLLLYSTTEPAVNDFCTLNGTLYRVQGYVKTRAQGSNIMYTVQLRA